MNVIRLAGRPVVQCVVQCLFVSALHNVLFGQYTFSWENNIFEAIFPMFFHKKKLENLFRFSFPGTKNIIFRTLKIGQNDPKIPNLEFANHGFLENQVFLPPEQAGTNKC